MRIDDIRLFFGGLNSDDDDRLLPQGDYRDAVNFRTGYSEDNNQGAGENIMGNLSSVEYTHDNFVLPDDNINKVIGSARDNENNCLIYFVYNAGGDHSIVRYNNDTKLLDYILTEEPILNFQYDRRYMILNPIVLSGLLYWTDNYNPPRKINIAKAAEYTLHKKVASFSSVISGTSYGHTDKLGFTTLASHTLTVGSKVVVNIPDTTHPHNNGYGVVVHVAGNLVITDRSITDSWSGTESGISGEVYLYNGTDQYYGLTEQIISQIKYPPAYPPTQSYDNDTDRDVNFVAGKLFRFRYRWVYDDNEKSVWSPVSQVVYPTRRELANGFFNQINDEENVINVWFDTGSNEVRKIEIAFQEGEDGPWGLIQRVNKYDSDGGCLLTSNVFNSYPFYNDVYGEGLDQKDLARNQDDVPILAGSIELVNKNRLVYGNYVEGYDNVDVDVSLSPIYTAVTLPVIVDATESFTVIEGEDRGTVEYTMLSSVPTSYPNALWQLRHKLDRRDTPEADPVYEYYNAYYMAKDGDDISDIKTALRTSVEENLSDVIELKGVGASNEILYHWYKFVDTSTYTIVDIQSFVYTATPVYKSHKYLSNHHYGIVYTDEAGRSGATNTSSDTSVFIPPIYTENEQTVYDPTNPSGYNSYKQVTVGFSISHKPPDWAKYWKWVYAKNNVTFTYGVASGFFEEDGKIKFMVNKFFEEFNAERNESVLKNYVWKKGDRIRFIGLKPAAEPIGSHTPNPDNIITLFQSNQDYEIIKENYYYSSTNDEYQKYRDGTYVKDDHGNRLFEPVYQELYVVGLDLKDLNIELGSTDGNLSDEVIVEIYSPLQNVNNDSLIYYETGDVYGIGTDAYGNKYHECDTDQVFNSSGSLVTPAAGSLDNGDVFIKLRFYLTEGYSFPVEDANYSDFIKSNVHDFGRQSTVIPDMVQKRYTENLLYGGVYIQNTLVNDLAKVDAYNSISLNSKFGPITGMREVGYTLKVLQEQKSTSIYIGKVALKQAGGQGGVVATTDNIFGDINVSETEFGCRHPESIIKTLRYLYFYDFTNQKFVRDSANGLFAISEYKYNKAIRDLTLSVADDFDNTLCLTGYNTAFDEVVFSVTNIDSGPVNTFVFNESKNRWTYRMNLSDGNDGVDFMDTIGYTFISFLNGIPYIHGINELRGNFFGEQWDQLVEIVSNKEPLLIKTWQSVGVTSNKTWGLPETGDVLIPPSDTYARGMSSRIAPGRFVKREGMLYAPFQRNMLTHSDTATVAYLIGGDYLKGSVVRLILRNSHSDRVVLFGVKVSATLSK